MNKNTSLGNVQKENGRPAELIKKYGIVLVLVFMFVLMSIAKPSSFLSATNIFNILTQSSIFGILALGMTLVIISKGIDISVGSILAFAGVVCASLGQVVDATDKFFPQLGELSMIVPILAALLVGAGLGAVNGMLIAFTGLPAFIATLGMQTIARGFALLYTSGRPVSNLQSGFEKIGGNLGSIPVPVIIYAICIAITWILLNNTRFGKTVYAIGANIKAAEVSGVPVKRNLTMIYAYCGLLSGVAALVFAGRTGSVHPGAAVGFELTAIAATTIGGTSHSGGVGTVWGAIVGALILGTLMNGLTLLAVNPYWQQVIQGFIIVVAVMIDMRKNAKKS